VPAIWVPILSLPLGKGEFNYPANALDRNREMCQASMYL